MKKFKQKNKIEFEGHLFWVEEWEDEALLNRTEEWNQDEYECTASNIDHFTRNKWAKNITEEMKSFIKVGKKYKLTIEEVKNAR